MRKWYGKLAIIGVLLLVVGLAMQSWNAPVLRVGVLPGMQADFMKEVRAAADRGRAAAGLCGTQHEAGPR